MAADTMETTNVVTNLEELIVELYPEYPLEAEARKNQWGSHPKWYVCLTDPYKKTSVFDGEGATFQLAIADLARKLERIAAQDINVPMDVQKAARAMLPMIDKSDLPDDHPAYGKAHLREMVGKIQDWDVGIAKWTRKAHRWLGWINCAVCMGDGATLEELKAINRES
jgi:hypothetical protein